MAGILRLLALTGRVLADINDHLANYGYVAGRERTDYDAEQMFPVLFARSTLAVPVEYWIGAERTIPAAPGPA